MMHDNSQPDIPNHHSLTDNLEPRVSYSKEIGEATITHTIFGKARVRITRKYDNIRRAFWLTALAALAVAGWQAWLATQPAEPVQSADSLPPPNEQAPGSQPVSPPASITQPAAVPAAASEPVIAPASEIAKPAIAVKNTPQPAKPMAPQTWRANTPQSAPLAANAAPLPNRMDKPLPSRPIPPAQPAPAVAAARATLPAAHPAASSPAVIAPLASPLGGEAAPTPAPAAAGQAIEPAPQ